MRTLVSLLPALACVGMMLFICLPMIRGRHKSPTEEAPTREEVAALREEVARLREEERAVEGDKTLEATDDPFR
jgi:hypothetical protein